MAGSRRADMDNQSGWGQRNRRFSNSFQSFPYYPSYGYGGYGNAVYQNPDEADWAEQWQSLYEDNDGPYARSTRENAPGEARMWVFPEEKQGSDATR
jgi:hypothetical protein